MATFRRESNELNQMSQKIQLKIFDFHELNDSAPGWYLKAKRINLPCRPKTQNLVNIKCNRSSSISRVAMTVIFPDLGRSWDGTGASCDASKTWFKNGTCLGQHLMQILDAWF
jgi:hypothetical protein